MRAQLQILDLPVDRIEAELVAVPYFSNQRPLKGPAALLDWRLDGYLTRQLLDGEARGVKGDRYLVRSNGKISSAWVMFVGCGELLPESPAAMQVVVDELIASVAQAGFRQIGVGLPAEESGQVSAWQQLLENALKSLSTTLECQLSACDPSIYHN